MKIGITDQSEDDFIRGLISVKAEEGGFSRIWKIPRRLMMRPDVAGIVVEELMAEVKEARDAHVSRILKEVVSGRP